MTVILLWLATMTWLVWEKVLPTMLVGEPPNYQAILRSRKANSIECWYITCNEKLLGWSASRLEKLPQGVSEIYNWVHLKRLPLKDVLPPLLRRWAQPAEEFVEQPTEIRSRLTFDPLGRLADFESRLSLFGIPGAIKVRGQISDNELHIAVHANGVTHEARRTLPEGTMVSEAFSPQTRLPGLREGQSWTEEVFSPFRPPQRPTEVLQATVERSELIEWNGQMVEAWVVVYRSDPGTSASRARIERGRMWVHPDGRVLRQEVMFLGGKFSFVRVPEDQAARLAEKIDMEPTGEVRDWFR